MLWRKPSMAKASSASICAVDRGGARGSMRDELCNHGVVEDRDFAAFVNAGVVAHRNARQVRLGRRAVAHETPDGRQKIARRVLRIDPRLDRPAGKLHIALPQRELLACGDPDHLLDEIDAGHQLGDRMLDLQAGVHFEEVEALVLLDDELDRAGRVVADGPGQRDRLRRPSLRASLASQERRGRFFHDLLVAALDRAFALAQVDDVAVLVAQHLDLDMARIDDEFLDEDARRRRRRTSPRARALKAGSDIGLRDARCACPCRRRRPRP